MMSKIEGGNIVIRIPIKLLSEEWLLPAELLDDTCNPTVVVTDAKKFAKDFIYELEREEEDGSTPVHRLLDTAFVAAIGNGAEGVDYDIKQSKKVKNERTKRC